MGVVRTKGGGGGEGGIRTHVRIAAAQEALDRALLHRAAKATRFAKLLAVASRAAPKRACARVARAVDPAARRHLIPIRASSLAHAIGNASSAAGTATSASPLPLDCAANGGQPREARKSLDASSRLRAELRRAPGARQFGWPTRRACAWTTIYRRRKMRSDDHRLEARRWKSYWRL